MPNEPSASNGCEADDDKKERTRNSKSSDANGNGNGNGGAAKENVTGNKPKIDEESASKKSPEMGDSSNGRTSLGKRKASEEEGKEEKGEGPAQEKKCRKWQETLKDDEVTKKVYIWDLDETLIIFQSLLSGTFAQQQGIDITVCESAALEMEDLIVATAETKFFFNELERDGDRVHIHDVDEDVEGIIGPQPETDATTADDDDDGNAAAADDALATSSAERLKLETLRNRYRQIKNLYEANSRDNAGIFDDEDSKNKWAKLRERIESLTSNWVSEAASKCLSAVVNRPQKSVSVIVTNSQLVAAFVKLILNDIAIFFPAQNVYSSSKVGKEFCFSSIRERFPSASFVVIGDGREEETAAEKMDFLFWKVSSKRDLNSLATAIHLNYM